MLTGVRASLLHPVPRMRLKPPMPMNTNLHACGREANQNHAKTKAKTSSDVLRLQKGLSIQFQNPPSLILRANVVSCPDYFLPSGKIVWYMVNCLYRFGSSILKSP